MPQQHTQERKHLRPNSVKNLLTVNLKLANIKALKNQFQGDGNTQSSFESRIKKKEKSLFLVSKALMDFNTVMLFFLLCCDCLSCDQVLSQTFCLPHSGIASQPCSELLVDHIVVALNHVIMMCRLPHSCALLFVKFLLVMWTRKVVLYRASILEVYGQNDVLLSGLFYDVGLRSYGLGSRVECMHFQVQGVTVVNLDNNSYVFSQGFQSLLTRESTSGPRNTERDSHNG